MKTKYLIYLFLTLFSLNLQAQCNIQASVCQAGVAGPFSFQSGGHNAFNSTCLDQLSYSQYGFIVLYVTTSGNLNMLINGDASSGFLDVAVFNVPDGVAPCTAIQSSSNQINCNYASSSNGCNQFGNSFPCSSSVPSVAVTAGQTIMIVVEDWENGPSNSFTLELAPSPSAQTGVPDATIISAGPFCTTDGLMQVTAENMGGTWSGPGMSPNGMINPPVAGPGVHTINYSIGVAPCNATSSTQITIGSIAVTDMNVGTCQPGGVYNVTGDINVLQPPSSGDLIVESCDGNQVVVASAPFSTGSYPFDLGGLTANGTACNIHAYFTGSACSHILTYTAPTCPPSCGFTSAVANANGCQADNTFNVTGTLNFLTPPSTGQLIVEDCNGNSLSFNPPFTSPMNFTFNSLTPDGQNCTVSAYFTAEPSCSITTSYTAPTIPVVSAGNDVTICDGGAVTLTASGADTYQWNNNAGTNASATVSPPQTTVYTVTGSVNGCTASDQVTVSVSDDLVITVSPDVAICEGESTTITASGGDSYSWNNNLGAGATHTVSPSVTTTYVVSATDVNGCTGTNQTVVTVHPNPLVSAANVSTCESEPVDVVASGAQTYVWSPSVFLNSGNGSQVTFTPGSSTTYTVVGTDNNGCEGSAIVSVTVSPNPVIEAGNNVSECEGNSIVLSATGAGTGGNYVWTNNVVNGVPFTPPAGTTVYSVVAYTALGCVGTDSLIVNVGQSPEVSFEAVQDQNCVPVTATFMNTSPVSGVTCLWLFDNGQTVAGCGDATQTFNHPGIFGASLQITSANGCVSVLYQDSMVIVDALPKAAFIPTPTVFELLDTKVKFKNNSTGATSYIWDFGTGGASSTEVNPSYTYPDEIESYVVTLIAVSEAGCMDTTEYIVRSEEGLVFYIPNTFTPDGDEFNQVFQPVFTSGFDPYDYKLMIFNRWGEMVFESNDASVGWKGTYGVDGKICQDGMYTWKIEFKTIKNDERKMYVGHINLIR